MQMQQEAGGGTQVLTGPRRLLPTCQSRALISPRISTTHDSLFPKEQPLQHQFNRCTQDQGVPNERHSRDTLGQKWDLGPAPMPKEVKVDLERSNMSRGGAGSIFYLHPCRERWADTGESNLHDTGNRSRREAQPGPLASMRRIRPAHHSAIASATHSSHTQATNAARCSH